MTTIVEPVSPSSLVDSTSSQASSQPSLSITRTYKSANQLFLTRRVREALETLTPLIYPSSRSEIFPLYEEAGPNNPVAHNDNAAPIATASRTARIRVWSLYISVLNEVIEMGSEAGKQTFGASWWEELVAKARDGSFWEDVVMNGYYGVEGSVDPDVVANLATLLLAHAPAQKLTQHRLESYLSAYGAPSLDFTSHMEGKKVGAPQPHTTGTGTPRDLNSRLKILEIYTLHVLPRNEEWDYARNFICMSEILDEERREAFLQALQSVQEESSFDLKREAQLQRQRDQQLEEARKEKEAQEDEEKRKRHNTALRTSEHDYGIDRSRIGAAQRPNRGGSAANGEPATAKKPPITRKGPGQQPNQSSGSAKGRRSSPPGLQRRLSVLLVSMQREVMSMGHSFKSHPLTLLRILAFIVAIIMAVARRDVRDRLARIRDALWDKAKGTVGMGVKVSYI